MKRNCLLLILALFFVACNTKNRGNYEKIPYLCDISCVAEASEPTHYFIGFENGVIIKASLDSNDIEFYDTKLHARIYDIVEDDTILWLGVRDRGLVEFDTKKKQIIRDDYKILTFPKDGDSNTNYAVYDLEKDGDTIYLATTRGLFSINTKISSLSEVHRKDTHHVIYKLLLIDNSTSNKNYLYYSETYKHESRVSIYDIKKQKHYPLEYIHNYSHFFSKGKGDTVYCIHSDNTLCSFYNINNHNEIKTKETKGENLFAYFKDTNKKYFLTNERFFSEDEIDIDLPEGIQNRHKNHIIDISSHFIIASGKYIYKIAKDSIKKEETRIIREVFTDTNTTCIGQNWQTINKDFAIDTATKIYRFDGNDNIKLQDTFQPEIKILTNTLYDNQFLYFITKDNTLYEYNDSKNEVNRIKKLSLKDASSFIGLRTSEKHLWLLTERYLYQIEKTTGTFAYINTSSYKSIRQDLTSIYYDKDKNILYLGGRKHLFYLKNADKTIIAQNKDSLFAKVANPASIHSDLYITDFCKKNNTMFFGTLNNGLFCLVEKNPDNNDSIRKDTIIPATPHFVNKDSAGNILVLTMTEDVIQTTNGLYKQMDNKWEPIVPVDNIEKSHNIIRILPNTNICIGYRGIYVDGTWQHLEVWANPKAICNSGAYVFLGSNSGLYKYNKIHDSIKQIKIDNNDNKCLECIRTFLQKLTFNVPEWYLFSPSEKMYLETFCLRIQWFIQWFIQEIGIINLVFKIILLGFTIYILYVFCYKKHKKYKQCKKDCPKKCPVKIQNKDTIFTYFGRKLFISKYYDYRMSGEDEDHYNKWKNHHPYNQFSSYSEYSSNAELERDRRTIEENGFLDEYLKKRMCYKIRTLCVYLMWCFVIYAVSIVLYILQNLLVGCQFFQSGCFDVIKSGLDLATSVLLAVSYFNLQYSNNDIQHKPFANWVTIMFSMLCFILLGLQILSMSVFKETANENIIAFLIEGITSLIAALALSLFASRMYIIYMRNKMFSFIFIIPVLFCASANIALCFGYGVFKISNSENYQACLHLIVSVGMLAFYWVVYKFMDDKNLKIFFMNEINKTKTFSEEHLGIAELHLLMKQKTKENVLLETKNEDLEELMQINRNQKRLGILKIIKKEK